MFRGPEAIQQAAHTSIVYEGRENCKNHNQAVPFTHNILYNTKRAILPFLSGTWRQHSFKMQVTIAKKWYERVRVRADRTLVSNPQGGAKGGLLQQMYDWARAPPLVLSYRAAVFLFVVFLYCLFGCGFLPFISLLFSFHLSLPPLTAQCILPPLHSLLYDVRPTTSAERHRLQPAHLWRHSVQ